MPTATATRKSKYGGRTWRVWTDYLVCDARTFEQQERDRHHIWIKSACQALANRRVSADKWKIVECPVRRVHDGKWHSCRTCLAIKQWSADDGYRDWEAYLKHWGWDDRYEAHVCWYHRAYGKIEACWADELRIREAEQAVDVLASLAPHET